MSCRQAFSARANRAPFTTQPNQSQSDRLQCRRSFHRHPALSDRLRLMLDCCPKASAVQKRLMLSTSVSILCASQEIRPFAMKIYRAMHYLQKVSLPLQSFLRYIYPGLYGKTMFYSFRLPGFGRTDCTDNGRDIAGKHQRHDHTDAIAQARGGLTGMGSRRDRFPHR